MTKGIAITLNQKEKGGIYNVRRSKSISGKFAKRA
jgi:hypothetical protein